MVARESGSHGCTKGTNSQRQYEKQEQAVVLARRARDVAEAQEDRHSPVAVPDTRNQLDDVGEEPYE